MSATPMDTAPAAQDRGVSLATLREGLNMAEYRVIWEIDLDADDPRDAAWQARAAQVRPGTTALVFDVTDRYGNTVSVDLADEEG